MSTGPGKESVQCAYGKTNSTRGSQISYFLTITDSEKLIADLENDELVNRELSNAIGLLVLKGGRFVVLASGLIQVANHVVIEPTQLLIREPATKLQTVEKSS